MPEKEFIGIGRGYLTALTTLLLATIMGIFIIVKEPGRANWVLDWWQQLVIWVIGLVLVPKEAGKIGRLFGEGFKSKHTKP